MKNLITLLASFKSVSTAMEGDKYPTLHGVLLWKKKLLIHCQRKFSDSLAIKCLKSNLALLIEKKWNDFDLHKVALFCFPKFKSLSVLPASMKEEVIQLVQSMLSDPKFNKDDVDDYTATSQGTSVADHNYQKAKRRKTDFALDNG